MIFSGQPQSSGSTWLFGSVVLLKNMLFWLDWKSNPSFPWTKKKTKKKIQNKKKKNPNPNLFWVKQNIGRYFSSEATSKWSVKILHLEEISMKTCSFSGVWATVVTKHFFGSDKNSQNPLFNAVLLFLERGDKPSFLAIPLRLCNAVKQGCLIWFQTRRVSPLSNSPYWFWNKRPCTRS